MRGAVDRMMSSSRVIKRVDGEMEPWAVRVRTTLAPVLAEEPAGVTEEMLPEAERLLAQARLKADTLMDDTNQRISQLEQAAYEEGYNRGQQQGLQEYQQAIADYHRFSQDRLGQINRLHQQIYDQSESELVDLAVHIAQKLVCRQLELDPGTVVDIARSACLQAKDCEVVIIYAAPAQLDSLKSRKEEIEAQLFRAQKIEFVADPTIVWGGCRLETEQGYIDATIDSMTEQIRLLIRGEAG